MSLSKGTEISVFSIKQIFLIFDRSECKPSLKIPLPFLCCFFYLFQNFCKNLIIKTCFQLYFHLFCKVVQNLYDFF